MYKRASSGGDEGWALRAGLVFGSAMLKIRGYVTYAWPTVPVIARRAVRDHSEMLRCENAALRLWWAFKAKMNVVVETEVV